MKRAVIIALACLLAASLSFAKPGTVKPGTYDVTSSAKFWTEMFKGGGPGQVGNTLMALGDGFLFDKATLESGGWETGTIDGFLYNYKTTYAGGDLTLGPQGPWFEKGPGGTLKVKNLKAVNYNLITSPDPFNLHFKLVIEGLIEGTSYTFKITAEYTGHPEVKYDESGKPVFMKATVFDSCVIKIQ